MLALEWKGRTFMEKVNSRCFCWFPAAIMVDCPPKGRLHTKLYKGAWNVSANNSETVGHKDLRFGQIVYILVFYNISFSWLLPLDGFQFIFLCRAVPYHLAQLSSLTDVFRRACTAWSHKTIKTHFRCSINLLLTADAKQRRQQNILKPNPGNSP